MTEYSAEKDAGFCPHCGVTNDLHDGSDTCASADAKARLLESFPFGGYR